MEVSSSLLLTLRTRAVGARTTRTHTLTNNGAQFVAAGLLMVITYDERMAKALLESCSEAIDHHDEG